MQARKLTNRRAFLRLTVAGAICTAIAACAAPTPPSAPTATTAPQPSPTTPLLPTATTAPLTPTTAPPTATTAPQSTTTPVPKPAATIAPSSAAPASIAFWWGWMPDYQVTSIRAVVKKFEEKNPRIQVSTAQHSWGEMLLGALLGGTAPDLFEWNPPTQLAAKDWLIPLDDLLGGSKVVGKSTFLDVSLKQGSWKGKLYGLPALEHFATLTTVVNEGLYQQKGLKIPGDVPKTLEEALIQGKKYTTMDQAGNIDQLWYAFWSNPWRFGASFGIQAYDEDNQKFRFDDPGWKEVLKFFSDYAEALGYAKVNAWFGSHSYLAAAILDLGYWTNGTMAHEMPNATFTYTWNLVPNSRKGKKVQLIGEHYVAIPTTAKRREEAWLLAEHLVSNESIKTIFDGCGFLLATKPLLEKPESVIDTKRYRNFDFHISSIKEADELRGYPACPIRLYVDQMWNMTWDAVGTKQKTVDQALADLQKSCTEQLATVLKA